MDNAKLSLKMGKRLKELRENKGLSHEKLGAELYDRYKDSNMTKPNSKRKKRKNQDNTEGEYERLISKDSLINYEVQSQDHTKAFTNNGMCVEYLRYLADYYNVSADYLIGLSDIPTSDETIQGIHKKTGLSEVATENLCELSPAARRLIDDLLTSKTDLESIAFGYELMRGAIKTKNELLDMEKEVTQTEIMSEITNKTVDDIDVYRFRLAFQFAKFAEKEQED